jgi:hypothetical protein
MVAFHAGIMRAIPLAASCPIVFVGRASPASAFAHLRRKLDGLIGQRRCGTIAECRIIEALSPAGMQHVQAPKKEFLYRRRP